MKEQINDYGKGRANVLMEMLLWINKEINKIKEVAKTTDTHARATMSGQIRAYSKAKNKIKVKIQNLKNENNLH